MKKTRFNIRLQIIVPLIFTGLAATAFVVAYRATASRLAQGQDPTADLALWGCLLVVFTFVCGVVVARAILKPVQRFVEDAEKHPLFHDDENIDGASSTGDELARFATVFEKVTQILSRVEAREHFPDIVARSRVMRGLMGRILKVAETGTTVLIRGESGTGKDLVARAIHSHGPRKSQPFIKINCAAIPENLMESELFGAEKGAYTGAVARTKGKFQAADKGVVFLDEIGDMPLNLQGKLLRVLEDKEFERVGSATPIKADVRFIAATNRNLAAMVEEGSFRQDLYYRLSVVTLDIPPLRQRDEDIPDLARDFLARRRDKEEGPNMYDDSSPSDREETPDISQEVLDLLAMHRWPGNVRELQNVLEQAALACESGPITPAHLPAGFIPAPRDPTDKTALQMPEDGLDLDDHLKQTEKNLIQAALRRTGGVQSRAARLLGIKERSLWHRVRKLGIDPNRFKPNKK